MTTPADRIEAAAQLLHERRHRAGTAQVCGVCRDDVAAVAAVLGMSSPHVAVVQPTSYRVGSHPFDAFEARCRTCRIVVGPLTRSIATAWVQGHNRRPAEDHAPPVIEVEQIDGGFVVTWAHGATSGGQVFSYSP